MSPKILALDTATEACSAALLTERGVITRYLEAGRTAGDQILAMVDEVLREGGLTLRYLDAVAFGRGPGGFTGVRLGVSVAQGLAFGADRPVVPISDLQALAQQVLDLASAVNSGANGVLVCNDARMQEVYWGCFRRSPSGLAEAVGIEQVSKPEDVTLSADLPTPIQGVGHGFREYPVLRQRFDARLSAIHANLLPRAQEVARLAVAEVQAGRTLPADQALPVYLRNNVAHVRI